MSKNASAKSLALSKFGHYYDAKANTFYATEKFARKAEKFGTKECDIMDDFMANHQTLVAWLDQNQTEAVIPENIKAIGRAAFCSAKGLKNVSLPDTVHTINNSAFGYSSIESITLPDSITSVENDAFENCTSLEVIYCSEEFEKSAADNPALKGVRFERVPTPTSTPAPTPTPTPVAEETAGMKYANGVYIGVGYSPMGGEIKVQVTVTNDTITHIELLKQNETPGVGDAAFDLLIPEVLRKQNADVDSVAGATLTSKGFIQAVQNALEKASPTPVTKVPAGLEYTIKADGTVEITKYTGKEANLVLPDVIEGKKVTSIGEQAFAYCYDLAEITLPKNLKTIEGNPFTGNITSVTVAEGNSVFEVHDGMLINVVDQTLVAWLDQNQTEAIIPENIKAIGSAAFWSCSNLKSVSLPDTLYTVGASAFGYSSIESITLPNSIADTVLAVDMFRCCSNLREVTLPDSITSADTDAFLKCTSLEVIYCSEEFEKSEADNPDLNGVMFARVRRVLPVATKVPAGLEYTIKDDGTVEITKYTGTEANLVLPDVIEGKKVTSISKEAFRKNKALVSIKLPDSLISIGDRAFFECSKLSKVDLPDSPTSIGVQSFAYCHSLETITLPNTLKEMAANPFTGNAMDIQVAENHPVFEVRDGMLINKQEQKLVALLDSQQAKVVVPEDIKCIGVAAFYDCSQLQSVSLPDSVTSIEEDAFGRCKSLEQITLPGSLISMGVAVFQDCTNLETICGSNDVAKNYAASLAGVAYTDITTLKYTIKADGTVEITKYKGTEANLVLQTFIGGGFAKAVRDTDAAQDSASVFSNDFADGAAKAVEDVVILHGYDRMRVADGSKHCLCIQRFNGVHIQHSNARAFFFQLIRCCQCDGHDITIGDNGHVRAFSQLLGLADLKGFILIIDEGNGIARETQIYRTVVLCCCANQFAGRPVVTAHDDGHVGQCAQNTHVLDSLMAGAVVGGGETSMRTGDLHIQLGIADLLTDLLAHAHGAKYSIGRYEGDLSAGRQTGSHTAGVLFGNTDINMLIGQLFGEFYRLAALADVSIHHIDIRIFKTQSKDLIAIRIARRQALHFAHCSPASTSRIACAYCSSLGAVPCHMTTFSMKDTPRPLTVSITMQCGIPSCFLAFSSASRTAFIS